MQTNNDFVDKTIVHQCSYCAKVFKYESDKRRHENSHNPQFRCNICEKKFSFLSALKRHKKQHDRSDKVECKKCGKSFKDNILLQRHYDYAHKGTYTCKLCKSVFHSSLALRNHTKVHKFEDRKYVCTYTDCGKKFYSAQHLKHHQLNHTNTKQYYCDDCGKGFIQRNHLKSHIMMHRPEDWMPCSFEGCKKTFPTEYARKRHLETHEKKRSSESKVELRDHKEYLKEPPRKDKSSKKTKRTHNHVLKESRVCSNNRTAKADCSNPDSESQYKDEVEKYIVDVPLIDFEYNNVIEIIRADNDAAVINYTKLPDKTQVISSNDIDILNTKEKPVELEKFELKSAEEKETVVMTDSPMRELSIKVNAIDEETHNSTKEFNTTPEFLLKLVSKVKQSSTNITLGEFKSTQDTFDELTSTKDAMNELSLTQDAIDELTSTQDAIDVLTSSQDELTSSQDELTSTQDELTSTQDAIDELISTQDAIDDFTSTQDALDELTSTHDALDELKSSQDATDELTSNTGMIDDFRCGDCDCTSIKLKDLDFINNINDKIELPLCKKVMPNLEHREDGAIKLIDTFEFDSFPDDDSDDKGDDENSNHTCKSLFGNCLVSGNSKVSIKCICAKISKCQNVEEIEDITPYPST